MATNSSDNDIPYTTSTNSSGGIPMDEGEDEQESTPITLVDAIKTKYCSGPEKYYNDETLPVFRVIKEFAPQSKPGALPIQKQTNIVIEGKYICDSGPQDELVEMCPNVVDVDLRENLFANWESIFHILSSMPSLKVLNLSRNVPLSGASTVPPVPSFAHTSLSTLYLSCTSVPFASVVTVLSLLPNLNELHLSYNFYTDDDIQHIIKEEPSPHYQLTNLYFCENQISNWHSIDCIGHIFPNLHYLMLNANPLQMINPVPRKDSTSSSFSSLQSLHLTDTLLHRWDSIENLTHYSSLKSVSLLRVPLGKDMDPGQRRYATISRLPGLEYLNKSVISKEEREAAERWLLREFNNHPEPPLIYDSLIEKHGQLRPLQDIKLLPITEANLVFTYEGIEREEETVTVNLMQNIRQFKNWVAQHILVPPFKLKLFYIDSELNPVYGSLELKVQNKRELFSYRMKDGDKIEVVVKD